MSPQDEGELVNEQTYLVEVLEWAKQEYLGVKITSDTIKKLMALVKRGEYPEENVADEIVIIYERLVVDYEYAQELAEDMVEPVEIPKETQMLKASDGIELSTFSKKFNLGAGMTQCVPRGEVTMEDWVGAFSFGLALESGSQWIIGDSVVALENAGHDDVVNQLCSKFKKSYSTVSGYARACREYTPEKRDPMLPFTVYRELGNAKLETSKRDELLNQAKTEHLSSTEVRNRVRAEQGKNVDEHLTHRYLVLNISDSEVLKYLVLNISNSEVLTRVPDKLEPHHLLIDLAGKRWYDPACEEYINFLKGK
jgi:hypothetical protein